MKKSQFKEHHGFNDFDMDELETVLKSVAGKIVVIVDNPSKETLRPPA